VNRWLRAAAAFRDEGSRRVLDHRVSVHAGSLTYGAFLSLPPLVLLALSVVGFVLSGRPEAQEEIADALVDAIPGLSPVAGPWIDSVVDGRTVIGVLAVPTVVYTGLGVIARARAALADVFALPPTGLVRFRLQGLPLLVPLGVAFLALVVGISYISSLSYTRRLERLDEVLALTGVSVVAVGWAFVSFWLLTPGRPVPPCAYWPGAVAFGISFVVVQRVAALLAPLVGQDVALYGALSATFGLLAYIYALAFSFLLSAELSDWYVGVRASPGL